MKQKYKVFINDKEILFQSDEPLKTNKWLLLGQGLSPDAMFEKACNTKSEESSVFLVKSEDPFRDFNHFIKSFSMMEAAGGIVTKQNDKSELLVIYRLGFWDLPKGKIEPDESVEIAALREVEEECGISNLTILKKATETYHIYIEKGVKKVKKTHWYLMHTSDEGQPIPQTNEGIEKAQWMNAKEVEQILPECYKLISELIESHFLNR